VTIDVGVAGDGVRGEACCGKMPFQGGKPMSKIVETLRLKERGEEDIYFAKRDQELIQALHRKRLATVVAADTPKEKKLARSFEKHYRKINRCCRMKPLKLMRALRRLIDKILAAFHRVTETPDKV
jgi:hypothetical protein